MQTSIRYRSKSKDNQKQLVSIALKEQNNRSSTSILEDPVGKAIPENAIDFKFEIGSGKFISQNYKKCIFTYKMFSDSNQIQHDDEGNIEMPCVAFSLYVKIGK